MELLVEPSSLVHPQIRYDDVQVVLDELAAAGQVVLGVDR